MLGVLPFFVSASQAPAKKPSMKEVTPIEAIKDLDRQVDLYRVGKNLTAADHEFNRELKRQILRGIFDLRELARLALDQHWVQLTVAKRDEFVELLTNLLETRSVTAKENAVERGEEKSYIINYRGQDYLNPLKSDALAKTTIRLKNKGLKIALNYKLKKNSPDWKIYDVIMDDASLVANYRHSFDSIIKKNGYPELIQRMKKKLEEFRSKK